MNKGIESFKTSVQKDTTEGENCFNENGCDHEFTRMVPQDNPKLLEMGITQSCISVSKCFHKYCDKYKWVMDRAKHYSEKSGKSVDEIIKVWEENRTYWYMNYYQANNQPLSGTKPNDEQVISLKVKIVVIGNEVKTYESLIPTLTDKHQKSVRKDFERKLETSKKELAGCNSRLALYEVGFFDN
jgi:hypothetical protein